MFFNLLIYSLLVWWVVNIVLLVRDKCACPVLHSALDKRVHQLANYINIVGHDLTTNILFCFYCSDTTNQISTDFVELSCYDYSHMLAGVRVYFIEGKS